MNLNVLFIGSRSYEVFIVSQEYIDKVNQFLDAGLDEVTFKTEGGSLVTLLRQGISAIRRYNG